MKFKPMTEEEINEVGLLQPGVYDFEIIECSETTSDAGNDMFALKLNVFEPDGKTRSILDWVLPQMPKKFKHIHDACGLADKFEAGEVTAQDFLGKTGKLKLEVGKPYTDKNGNERVNNAVEDYIKRENLIETSEQKDPIPDDGIPF